MIEYVGELITTEEFKRRIDHMLNNKDAEQVSIVAIKLLYSFSLTVDQNKLEGLSLTSFFWIVY